MLNNFNFKKSLGQNFINDENIINKMVNSIDIDKDTLVIEIGPGAGILSKSIIPKSKYSILYEIDTRLEDILDDTLKDYNNYKIIFNDFLKEEIKSEIVKYSYDKLYAVANLPYYITTPIIYKLTSEIEPDKILIMIQKEVADRLCASVNGKDYGYITTYLNYFYNIKKVFDVSRNNFTPKPNVDSSVIILSKRESNIKVKDVKYLDEFLKNCFKFKRKNLRNNLKGYDLNKINNILNKYGYDLSSRAENISIDIFVEIVNVLLGWFFFLLWAHILKWVMICLRLEIM